MQDIQLAIKPSIQKTRKSKEKILKMYLRQQEGARFMNHAVC